MRQVQVPTRQATTKKDYKNPSHNSQHATRLTGWHGKTGKRKNPLRKERKRKDAERTRVHVGLRANEKKTDVRPLGSFVRWFTFQKTRASFHCECPPRTHYSAHERCRGAGFTACTMRGPPVGRQLGALLLVLLCQTATSQLVWPVAPWDCTRYPFPIQIMKGDDDDNYRTMQLNLGSGDFEEIWQWPANTAQLPTARLNAQGYNINDNIAYGLFSTDPSSDPGYFCRFSDVRSSTECLCEARGPVSDDFPQGETPYWGNAATITRNGTYYLGHAGGEQIHKLPAVHSLTSPGDSLEYQTTDCNMTQVLQGRGSGTINVESWNLTAADMYDAYGLPNNCKGQCYMAVWTNSTVDGVTKMTTWTPGDQNFADFIDFEYSSSTYLIGLGARDASVWIIKLDGAGDVEGYSYSRVVVDYTGSTSSKRNMNGFGAGFRYDDRIYVRATTPHTTPHTTATSS